MVASSYQVVVSARAFADLDGILEHIKADSPTNAARMLDRLWQSMQSLRDLPHRYRVVAYLRNPERSVRRMPVPPYLVYYRIVENLSVVRILTVRHGHQRQPRRFE
jgi:plasmid stabilization system protein ParE